ncbi:MAG: S-adenosylmethionine-binding protein [Thaumarchaeota archaeon]|nr:S-adenosylmethionine-binding protein [Nitrososphaerota archaeon]
MATAREDLLSKVSGKFSTILIDPPWFFNNRTGKVGPEHKRLYRYPIMTMDEILDLPIPEFVAPKCHLYLWVPNALVSEGLQVMNHWGFTYKTNLIWYKTRKDGGPDRRGVGFYFRNVTEMVLFGIKGPNNEPVFRTRKPWNIPNIMIEPKRNHSRKPDILYKIIERCSYPPYLELFARYKRHGWTQWGNEMDTALAELSQGQNQNGTLHEIPTESVLVSP